jgi:hypothetical protein
MRTRGERHRVVLISDKQAPFMSWRGEGTVLNGKWSGGRFAGIVVSYMKTYR